MNPEFVRYYQAELAHLRVMAKEFADEYPAMAGRLGIPAADECADPFVERLLEGYAYLAARVHLKLDAEFPQFSEELLRAVYPDYLAPLPASAIVEFEPDGGESSLAKGIEVPRGSVVRLPAPPGRTAPCTFVTAHAVYLYPLRLVEVEYLPRAAALHARGTPPPLGTKAGLRMRLAATGGLLISEISLSALTVHLRGADGIGARLFEFLVRTPVGMAVVDTATGQEIFRRNSDDVIHARGFDYEDRLLPEPPAAFQGYRNLREFFLVPARYQFVDITGLEKGFAAATGDSIDLFIFSAASVSGLEDLIDVNNVSLYSTPAINLFEKLCDRLPVGEGQREFHVVVDRGCPTDYEVFSISRVRAHLSHDDREQEFTPLYAAAVLPNAGDGVGATRYYSASREQRRSRASGQAGMAFGNYTGSEVFLTLGDQQKPPFDADIRQLSVHVLCTNRDIPWYHAMAGYWGSAVLESAAPVSQTRVLELHGPRASPPRVQSTWRLLNHLSLNYLSLIDGHEGEQGGLALRRLLGLYVDAESEVQKRIADSIRGVSARPAVRRLRRARMAGRRRFVGYPIVAARGLEITLMIDESALQSVGSYLFGSVLERFLAKFASVNSFTETVLVSPNRQEICRWAPRTGTRKLL